MTSASTRTATVTKDSSGGDGGSVDHVNDDETKTTATTATTTSCSPVGDNNNNNNYHHDKDSMPLASESKNISSDSSSSSSHGRMDITQLVAECAASLTVTEPFLCNVDAFSLHDAMAATQLMDKKMDCCEIPISQVRLPPILISGSSTTTNTTAPTASVTSPLEERGENNNSDNDDERMVFPRPVPSGLLRDAFTPLPWHHLTMDQTAWISVEILVRLQALLSGSSVGESTFTCLYAHHAVLTDMQALLFPKITTTTTTPTQPSSPQAQTTSPTETPSTAQTPTPVDALQNQLQALHLSKDTPLLQQSQTNSSAGSTAQLALFAITWALVDITEVFRGVVLNADIYEEEDFMANTNNIRFFTADSTDTSSGSGSTSHAHAAMGGSGSHTAADSNTLACLEAALQAVSEHPQQDKEEVQIVLLVLGYLFGFLSVCSTMARITSTDLIYTVQTMQSITRTTVGKLELLQKLLEARKSNDDSSPERVRLIRQTFDSHVNRPSVGNTPVRRVLFRSPKESVAILIRITSEMDWALCQLLLRGNTIGRMHRMLDRVTRSDVNILTRSLLLLNLYFDERLLGQYSLTDSIVQNLQQFCLVPESLLANEHAEAFVNRLAKPIYDTLKLKTLSRNRQRAYIEAVMLQDWISLQNEAHLVDVHYRQEHHLDNSTPPYFSQYVLSMLIQLMDRHLSCGIQVGLFHGHSELAMAFWYRDFLLSAETSNASMMKRAKELSYQSSAPNNSNNNNNILHSKKAGGGNSSSSGGKKKNKNNHKSNGTAANQTPPVVPKKSPEDLEEDCELLLVGLKRMMCRGILRFIAATRQAGLLKDEEFEFTSLERIFEKRFEVFSNIRQPPALNYEDYKEGSDFTNVPQNDLFQSTMEWFQSCKVTVERLLDGIKNLDADYAPIQEEELRALLKVCVGNLVYLMKLRQVVAAAPALAMSTHTSVETKPAAVVVDFDFQTTSEFCIVKIS